MRNIIALLIACLFSFPACSQIVPAGKVARTTKLALKNAQRLHTATLLTPSKKILNIKFQYKQEYDKAILLYNKILSMPGIKKDILEDDIDKLIVNKTLRNTLFLNLEFDFYNTMQQEMEEYFHLTPQLPVFSASAAPEESFAYEALDYLQNHPYKPSWRLRETIKFGDMKQIKSDMEEAFAHPGESFISPESFPENEKTELLNLYRQAEENNAVIKSLISRTQLSPAEREELLAALRQSYLLYEELIQFAQNAPAVRETVEIYTQLAKETEAFIRKHHRAPLWENPAERELAKIFPVLVFNNQANMFEEMIPVMNKLYELTEQYPARRLSEKETLRTVKIFLEKHGHMPRPLCARPLFDAKPNEALLYEATLYWKNVNSDFVRKLFEIQFPPQPSRPSSF